ncbi:MAG: aspartate kinase [Thermoprotei archaeon]|nr:MAG: aspartate kinase [Thermoprotei archaeon]
MEDLEPVYVKLGGSFITHKDKPFSINFKALEKTLLILGRAKKFTTIVAGNGGGSFAHPVVKQWIMHDLSDLIKYCQNATRKLNHIIVDYLVNHGVDAVSIQTSAIIVHSSKEYKVFIEPVRYALRQGLIPVLYGECIYSETRGYDILSTEQVFGVIARYIKPKRIVLLTDVKGVYTCDPRKYTKCKVIDEITKNNLEIVLRSIASSADRDVTGSIYSKVKYMAEISSSLKTDVYVVSGFDVEDSISAILGKKPRTGTVIRTYE